jgi:ribosomal protein S12 methylthiotransferase
MPSVALQNLGCSKNIIDGERIAFLFKRAGYAVTGDYESADVIVVNTCAFIREAKEEAIEAILQAAAAKKRRGKQTLVVCGCFSERYSDEARKQFPEVDLWVGVHDRERTIRERFGGNAASPFERELSPPIATQFLKIAEGCSHACAFCAIPSIRGPFRSRPEGEIVAEAKWLEEQGAKELILVAQDTSYYGRDTGSSLRRLIETLLAAAAFPWMRLMYLHPRHVDQALLRLFASEKRLCPYFDLPLQHIADPLLAAMNRRPLSRDIRALIDNVRSTVPGAVLRSTFILGFPGETGAHFRELVRFVEEVRFDKLGVFPFSPEEGTAAFRMRRRPRTPAVMKRCETLMLLQREISRELLAGRVGNVVEVIIDGPSDDPSYPLQGRTRGDAPEIDGKVFIARAGGAAGVFSRVRIVSSSDYDCFAVPA